MNKQFSTNQNQDFNQGVRTVYYIIIPSRVASIVILLPKLILVSLLMLFQKCDFTSTFISQIILLLIPLLVLK